MNKTNYRFQCFGTESRGISAVNVVICSMHGIFFIFQSKEEQPEFFSLLGAQRLEITGF